MLLLDNEGAYAAVWRTWALWSRRGLSGLDHLLSWRREQPPMDNSRLKEQQNSRRAPSATRQQNVAACSVGRRRANKAEVLTSFIEAALQLIVRTHVRASAIQPVVLAELPVVQLVVELVGGGVERVPAMVVFVAVVVIQDGGLANGHPDDRAAVLVRAARAAVAVAALRPQQHRGDVVDLVGGLCAGALLGDPAALAPSVAGVQD